MSQGKTSLVFKPFRRTMGGTIERTVQEEWNSLDAAIDGIYARKEAELKFEEVYRFGYHLVIKKHGHLAYSGVESKIQKYLIIKASELSDIPPENLLNELMKVWNDHKMVSQTIQDVMLYVDRTFVVQQNKLPVFKNALRLFREIIIHHNQIRERFSENILENILNERNSQIIDRHLIKDLLIMLQDISISGINAYEEEFECKFLATTKEFYRQESQ